MHYLLEFDAYDTGTNVVETFRIGTITYVTAPSDTPANTIYVGAMMNAGELKRQLIDNGGTVGKPATNVGFFQIDNTDGSRNAWRDYGVGGRKFRLYTIGGRDAAFSSRVLIFTGTMRGWASPDLRKVLQLRIRDKLEELNTPLITHTYAGTTLSSGPTQEGDASMLGVPKACGFGDVLKVAPQLVNRFDLTYCASNGANNLSAAKIVVYDGGVALTNAGDIGYDILYLQTIPAGSYMTSLSSGLFRLGAAPAKRITADVDVATQTWAANKDLYEPGPVAKALLIASGISSGSLDSSSFDNLKSTTGIFRCGTFVDNLTTTILDAVTDILSSVSATITSTADDKFKVVALGGALPSANFDPALAPSVPAYADAVDTFTARDIDAEDFSIVLGATKSDEGDGVPPYKVIINHSHYQTTQSKSDLATSLNDGQVTDLGSDFRHVTGTLAIVQAVHPLATTLSFDTGLTNATGAAAEASRRLVLYGTYTAARNYITITVSMDRFIANATIDLGSVVSVDVPHLFRFSFNAFYVVGIHMKFDERKVTLTLWG